MKKSHVPVLVVGAGAAGTMLTLELARRGVNVGRSTACRSRPNLASDHRARAHARDPRAHRQTARRSFSRARHPQQGLRAPFRRLRTASAARCAPASTSRRSIRATRSCSCTGRARRSNTCASTRARTTARARVGHEVRRRAAGRRGRHGDARDRRRQEQVRCQYLVGCDGTNSRVRRALGLEQEESDY